MGQVATRAGPGPGWSGAVRPVVAGAGLAATSAALGVLLAALGAATHPAAVVVLPLVVLGALLTYVRPWTGVAGIVAAVPLALTRAQLGPLDPVELLAVGAAAATVLRRVADGRTPLPWPAVAWWPLAVGLLALLSATRAPDPTLAVGQLLLLAVGGLALLTTVGALRDAEDVRRVATVWCLTGIGVSVHALTGAGDLAATSGGLTVAGRPTGVFTSPNQLGAYAGMTLLVGLGFVLAARPGWQRLLGGAALLAAAAALGISLSRGAWVGTGIAGLAVVAASPAARRLAGRLLTAVLMAVVAVGALLPQTPPQVEVVSQRFETLAEGETSPYDNRDAIWAEALRQARDEPLLGQGPANFSVVSRRAVSASSFVGAEHAHSVPLNTAAEFGVPALVLVALFALSLLASARRTARHHVSTRGRALAAGVGGALLVQVVHGVVDYTLRNATLALLTWVLAGMVVALARGRQHHVGPA